MPRMRKGWRRPAVGLLSAVLLTWGLSAGGTPAAAAVACPSGTDSDFNGDGVRDVAIADPEATVAGQQKAGTVHIVYGGGKGNAEISQETAGVSGTPETGDQFGYSMAVYDADADGCSDIVVGAPYEDVGTAADAGTVRIVYGSTAGLGVGRSATVHEQGTDASLGGTVEAEDWVGYSLAAGKTSAGTPYLLIGIPGEDIGTVEDAGSVAYIHGTAQTVVAFDQDTDTGGPVPGVAEQDDRFGTALAATPTHFAVGSPGEGIGTTTFAGGTGVFSHTLVNGLPKPLFGLSQDVDGVTGVEEVGDQFGTALAMVPYRPSGASSTTESLLAVGIPGEDLLTTVDAGSVQVYRITASGTFIETGGLSQDTADVDDEAEAGDFFGKRLAAVNTAPNSTATGTTTRLAVGVPGEETTEEYPETGAVQILPLVGAPGASDAWLEPGNGIPSAPAPRILTGLGIGSSPSLLYVGVPYGPVEGRAVYGFPWGVASGGAPTQTWKPGEGGIPAGGVAFGATVR